MKNINDKKRKYLIAVAERLPDDGGVLRRKDVADVMTAYYWRMCCRWFAVKAAKYVIVNRNSLSLIDGADKKTLLGILRALPDEKIQVEIEEKVVYRLSEVSAMLDIPITTLRYWMHEFSQLRPERTSGGLYKYTSKDIAVANRIKWLLREKGCSIEWAKKWMDDFYRRGSRVNHVPACDSADKVIKLLSDVKRKIDDPYVIVKIEAVEKYLTEKK